MVVPAEYDPYCTMVQLFLMEAADMDADQLLLITRSDDSNLYFLRDNRVKKKVNIDFDLTPSLVDRMTHPGEGAKVALTHADNWGQCISLTLRQAPPVDLDCTMPLPRIDYF